MHHLVLGFDPYMPLQKIAQRMDRQHVGFLAIVDASNHLLGTITDQDIRRAVLNHKWKLEEVMNPHPPKIFESQLKKGIEALALHQVPPYLPVVTKDLTLVDILSVPKHLKSRPNKVVLMVGGTGSRLGDLTRDIPKPMLPLGHKPILQIILDSFIEYGFRDFYFCVNYKASIIKEYFGDGSQFGVSIQYVHEDKALGTAGSLSLVDRDFSHPMIVMNGDLITTLNFESLLKFHHERGAFATMCLHEYNYQLPFGVVHTRNSRILSLEEKPHHKTFVNAGIYVLEPAALAYIPSDMHVDMTQVFEQMVMADESTHAYIINEYWMDIGQVRDYEATRDIFTQFNL
ncbi:MAG: nucleotidyltransferase family protein [Bacteroidota bacterium]